MIWLTWRQFRVQALTAAAALAAFAILLAATGPHLASLYAASAITSCHGGSCVTAPVAFLNRLQATSPYPVVYLLGIGLVLAAPSLFAIGSTFFEKALASGSSWPRPRSSASSGAPR